MINIDKLKVKALMHKIGLRYNLRDEEVKKIVESPYEFSYQEIRKLKLTDIKTEEELNNIKTNFLFRGLGRLYIGFQLINRNNKLKNGRIKKLNKEGSR